MILFCIMSAFFQNHINATDNVTIIEKIMANIIAAKFSSYSNVCANHTLYQIAQAHMINTPQ